MIFIFQTHVVIDRLFINYNGIPCHFYDSVFLQVQYSKFKLQQLQHKHSTHSITSPNILTKTQPLNTPWPKLHLPAQLGYHQVTNRSHEPACRRATGFTVPGENLLFQTVVLLLCNYFLHI